MQKHTPFFIGILLTLFAAWLLIMPYRPVRLFTERLDNLGYDLQLRLRVMTQPQKPETPVAIIDIDDKSLNAVGRWPWPRDKLAALNNKLREAGASVIAYDIFFSEPEVNITQILLNKLTPLHVMSADFLNFIKQHQALFDNDDIFAKSLSENTSVLALGFLPRVEMQNHLPPPLLQLTPLETKELNLIQAKGYISNIDILQRAAKLGGFINIYSDSDGIIRHSPLLIQYKNGLYPALSLQAVLAFLNVPIQLITPHYGANKRLEGVQIGSVVIPTDANGQVLIPFIGRSYTFPYYSALDVLQNKLPKDILLGKILFIGTSATGLGDLQATAIENPFPGVEIQATLVNGLLTNNFSYKPAWVYGANLFLTVVFGLIATFSFSYLGPRALAMVIVFLPPLLLYLNNFIWATTGLILSLLYPLILILVIALFNIIYGYLFETLRREHLKQMFGQYVPSKHIDEMLKTKGDYGLRGEDRDMSVLFADIRNFTTISEKMSAAELVDMLNIFFTPMTEIIFKHRGTIDKYIGDLIMAFWGAPLRDKNHARHALTSALEMQKKLQDLQIILQKNNWPTLKIGIGINSGIMSVGDMGSRFRRNYTVLGDAVNIASRVESLTKFYGVNIIATEFTIKNQPLFVLRKLDVVRVKGKLQGLTIYEVICLVTELTQPLQDELTLYDEALTFYFSQQWQDALHLFENLTQQFPDTKIYQIYLSRIKEMKDKPFSSDWDGVYVHEVK